MEILLRENSIPTNISAETIDISETGSKLLINAQLPVSSPIAININGSFNYQIKDARIIWEKPLQKGNKFLYGVKFRLGDELCLKELIQGIIKQEIKDFFGFSLPAHIQKNFTDCYLYEKLDKRQIMKIIDFHPPFLKVDKMVVLGGRNKEDVLQSKAIAMGKVTTKDTAGHYNDTIFLALCGLLMASAASIHLATLFPSTAPQVIEASGVKPLKLLNQPKKIWKPSFNGTNFLVETTINNKKLQLTIMNTKITFGKILYGTIEVLKLILTQKESIFLAQEFPPL
ncbi:MAG: PilZ domain-containing protein [bacterium]